MLYTSSFNTSLEIGPSPVKPPPKNSSLFSSKAKPAKKCVPGYSMNTSHSLVSMLYFQMSEKGVWLLPRPV